MHLIWLSSSWWCVIPEQNAVLKHMSSLQGSNPEPRHVPWPEIEPTTFRYMRHASTNWATRPQLEFMFLHWLRSCFVRCFRNRVGVSSGWKRHLALDSSYCTYITNYCTFHLGMHWEVNNVLLSPIKIMLKLLCHWRFIWLPYKMRWDILEDALWVWTDGCIPRITDLRKHAAMLKAIKSVRYIVLGSGGRCVSLRPRSLVEAWEWWCH